jgi:two-component system nitrate/nitrite response regulator NarL
MASQGINQEKVLKISQSRESAFSVVIVGRDSLTGSLLANTLTHKLNCECAAIRYSDVMRVLGNGEVDLVIISADLNSIPGAGFDLASEVLSSYPSIPIIILLDEPVHDLIIRAFIFGARGVFNPQDSMDEFIDCVEHVRKGSIWAGKEVSDCLLSALRSLPAPGFFAKDPSSTLSTRELQVVQFAARGKTNKAIASELRLSEHTVKNYLFKSFEKLGVSSRVELLFYLTVRGHSFGLPLAKPLDDAPEELMDVQERRPRAIGE